MRDLKVTDVRIDFDEYGSADIEIDVTVDGVEYTATEESDGDVFTVTVTRAEDDEEVSEYGEPELHALITDAVYASWREVTTVLRSYRKTMAAMATAKIRKSLRVQDETAADEVG